METSQRYSTSTSQPWKLPNVRTFPITLQDFLLLFNTHPRVCMVNESTSDLKEIKQMPKMLVQKEKFLLTTD